MKRTFNGWLLKYCCALTGITTTSVKKLCIAMEKNAPQAIEAVFLYALAHKKEKLAIRYLTIAPLQEQWRELCTLSSRYSGRAEHFLKNRYDALPARLQKVYNAYISIEAHNNNDDDVVGLIAQKTNEALLAAGITKYKLCKDLSLNEGNVYAWLAGDCTKVSRETARKAWQYAESFVSN